ncbi:zinc finger protein 718-like [Battus philenor]|uniref:zinc finger protein 718-like n=1 Tax=Battus philenor TaxID=42288 RepID=UPI0035D06D7F
MEEKDATFCLLCARLKCFNKLIQVEKDNVMLHKTERKLERLNILYEDFKVISPKTICLMCIDSLNKATEFVLEVENAQKTLKDLYKKQIKAEDYSSEEDQRNVVSDNKSDCSITIKQEFNEQSDNSDALDNTSINWEASNSREINERSKNSKVTSLKHPELSWNDYLWTCAFCETQFASIEELKIHSMQYHQCCNAFKCNNCNIRKLHLKRFIVHVKRHRKYLKLLCYKCNRKFMFPHQLHLHMRKAHAPKSNYVCLGCNAEFESVDELNEHNRMFNRSKRLREIPMALKSVNSLACVICKKTFKTKGTLNTHLLIHTNRKREHTCEKCGKCFLNEHNLVGHMIMHDNIRPHHCEICKCSFKTSKQLKDHVGIHNGDKPHRCDQCGRGFRLQRYLNSHKIVHTDLLPYICSYCNKKFRFKTILNQHLRQHTGVKPYSCDICKRDFTNWPNYNKHMKRRHGLDMAKKKRTPEGVYPINPSTGEIIRIDESHETVEWKNKILQRKSKGRPRILQKESNNLNVPKQEQLL